MLGRHLKNQTKPDDSRDAAFVLPFDSCLAKSYTLPDGSIKPGRQVLDHCVIVGLVARELIGRMPSFLRDGLFPDGSALIAATHDIGKVSPTFQKKIYLALTQSDEDVLSGLRSFDAGLEKQWGGHAGVSQATADAMGVGRFIPEILGQHHGFSPNLSKYKATCEVFGGERWNAERERLFGEINKQLNGETSLQWPVVSDDLQSRVIAGLTTVSDWIGSGSLFEDPKREADKATIKQAIDDAGYIQPRLKTGLSFQDVFDFTAKDAQIKLIESVSQPGVYVLEAPMGLGKTEAALFAAYQMLERQMATGIYFALPTQLTSDKIHERVNAFLQRILADDSPHKQALLVHGQAWLKEAAASFDQVGFNMGEEANPGGAWFSRGKRGILAPFAVGTIDQALMAVMNVKHGFVRTFGLAGKVVILDEVHSYDSYTGTILDVLVAALRRLHCTVIILSATLTKSRRASLLGLTDNPPDCDAYPLISALPGYQSGRQNENQAKNQDRQLVGSVLEIGVEALPDAQVMLRQSNEIEALEEALRRADEGQQVLWIENTVKEAQECFRRLAARAHDMGMACGLLHSRFTKADRAKNEAIWVTHFGKDGMASRGRQGRILVGTQVLEQSLDIDADFLITRIAPTDMLLQRLGRLWRHSETFRPSSARQEAWLLAPDLAQAEANPESAFGATAKVYDPYVLCRSLAVWEKRNQVSLPSQIRTLIEATYAPQQESGSMARYLDQLERTREKLYRLALVGLSRGGQTLLEEKAQTRHSDQETTEVLLIRRYQWDSVRKGSCVTLLDGENLFVPENGRSLPRTQWRAVSAKLAQHTLNVAEYLAPEALNRQQVEWLGDYFYLGKPEYNEPVMLRVALVGDDGGVRALHGGQPNEKYQISYDPMQGYLTAKRF